MKYNIFKVNQSRKFGIPILILTLFTGYSTSSTVSVENHNFVKHDHHEIVDPVHQLKMEYDLVKIELTNYIENQKKLDSLLTLKEQLIHATNSDTISRTSQ